ncbi:MAG: sugar ABC transporter permease [Lachnospiraceae bacterium]|nr:sugar ABC transporter permease [Lachnospiraceae bacterium]
MKKRKLKEQILATCLILPSLIVFTIFMFWPLARTVYLSFFDWNMIKPVKKFVGFQNYVTLLTDDLTYKVLGNTLLYIAILLVINFVFPYILSFILSFLMRKGKGFYKTAFFLPSVISLVVGSILYVWILNPVTGPIAKILVHFGIVLPIWSKSEGLVIWILSLVTSWKVFGYNFIIVLSGVMGVPQEVIEAAKIDHVSNYRIFTQIILPMSSATGIYVFIITIVQGLQYVFTPIKVVTQGGPNYASSNLIYQTYHEAFYMYRTGVASAFSVLSMVLFVGLLVLEFKYVEKGVYYEN